MIYVSSVQQGNIRGVAVYVGRTSSLKRASGRLGPLVDCSFLGNPHWMKDESQRDHVCDLYERDFPSILKANQDVMNRMKEWVKGKDITLVCFCAPKRCHALTIKEWLERP